MVNQQFALTTAGSRRSGINFVCSGCGSLLYHIGIDGVIDGYGNKTNRSVYALQPHLSDAHETCTKCGRELNFDIDPERLSIKVASSGSKQ
jgi:hypothetical protein